MATQGHGAQVAHHQGQLLKLKRCQVHADKIDMCLFRCVYLKMNTHIIRLIKLVVQRPNFITHPCIVMAEPHFVCPACGVKVRTGGLCTLCYFDEGGENAD